MGNPVIDRFLQVEDQIKKQIKLTNNISSELWEKYAQAEHQLAIYMHQTHVVENIEFNRNNFQIRETIERLRDIWRNAHVQEHLEHEEYQNHLFILDQLKRWVEGEMVLHGGKSKAS